MYYLELPSFEALTKIFEYDPETGAFKWCSDPSRGNAWNGQRAGKPAFTTADKDGYLVAKFTNPDTGKKAVFRAHRIAWVFITGRPPENQIDHKNHDRADNRKENLREATDAQNKAHPRRLNGTRTSPYQGVFWQRKSKAWRAQIRINGRAKCLGLFETENEAAKVRDEAAIDAYGEFAHLNFPPQT